MKQVTPSQQPFIYYVHQMMSNSILYNFRQYKAILLSSLVMLALLQAGTFVWAEEPDAIRLSALELKLFSDDYSSETVNGRLERLEKSVFGQMKPGIPSVRLSALEKIISKYQAPAAKTTPSDDNNPPVTIPQSQTSAESSSLPDATDYPTVVSLERTIFARDFVRDPLQRRLERLENKVYGRSYPQLPMSDRVDNLLMRYPQANLGKPVTRSYDAPANLPKQVPMPLGNQPTTYPPYTQAPFTSDVYTKLSALESRLLGPSARHDGKLLTERLDILERKVYGFSQSGSIQDRVDHLVQSMQPGQSAQRNTASYQANTPSGSSLRNKNIQFGVGVSSQSQYQYSPELMNMLPNDIRQRVQSGNAVQGSNGSVTMTETTTTPSGFYTLPNGAQVYQPPMQYQQTYQMTPTIISPSQGGQTTPYQPEVLIPQTSSVRAIPEAYPRLDTLEMKVFNHINQTDAPEMRLWKLESYLTRGKSFSGYSINDRIENAWKIYQYQYLGNILQTPATPQQPAQ